MMREDLTGIIKDFVELNRTGNNVYKGTCPFKYHRSPLFCVIYKPERYFCDGCGATGDADKFIREYDKISGKDRQWILQKQSR